MNQYADEAVVLSRVDFGERDRILTILAKQAGKISVLAKSVRSQKSRLAGGTELLSTSQISYIEGKSNLKTLTGARLIDHFGAITKDLDKMNQAFEVLKTINKLSEDGHGQEYYPMVVTSLKCLGDESYDDRLVRIWFGVHVLHEMGVLGTIKPVRSDDADHFEFDHDDQKFVVKEGGTFSKNDLKVLDLSLRSSVPVKLETQTDLDKIANLVRLILKTNIFDGIITDNYE